MSARRRRPRLGALLSGVLLALVVLLQAAPAWAAVPQRWTIADSHGDRWQLLLVEPFDPAAAGDGRLRLNGLSPGAQTDHAAALQLSDAMGGQWPLGNRSAERVPSGAPVLPPGSAQFDLGRPEPGPSAFLPLQLRLTMADGSIRRLPMAPGCVRALSDLWAGASP
ncbi:DUF3122 domain-containing protein [Cyanobium sp. Morenito 9A2]|uniref:DUF3122 domain-containing protein n=1 Tax=Cyanobium sp. Morenito 9A2 TaxID=2823718 RepID=UPI0020CF04EE|nr:DUF3122 domain-containing protein [Cyanobium sp. Morenito 9A2]MCP9848519.1 DUF3122 domain-containing protein [Cyanobium sp. Morenito 9A2]